ncbi:MAG: HAD-IIA family hydrolase [Micrococcales bacterium]|nr:HAD-IIA family hydrolase [Micrococcales bacterium]
MSFGDVRALLCDLDGVVHRGGEPVPGAVDALRRVGTPVRYLTNNASRGPDHVAGLLTGFGVTCRASSVITSAHAAAAEVARRSTGDGLVLVVGAPALERAMTAAGLRVAPPDTAPAEVSVVVQGWGPQVCAADLAAAASAIHLGAAWVATNRDLTLPAQHGLIPGNGALVAAVATAVGHEPDVAVGKPERALYDLAVTDLGLAPEECLAVGDRLDTDILGARRAGIRSVVVLSGIVDLAAVLDAPPGLRPDAVVPHLGWVPGLIDGLAEAWELTESVALVHALREAGQDDIEAVRAATARCTPPSSDWDAVPSSVPDTGALPWR